MYMLEKDFNHEKFYKAKKSMRLDDRIMKNKSAEYAAISLYEVIVDKIELSKDSIAKGDTSWINKNGEVFCLFTEEMADDEISMSSRQYKSRKKFLKEAGLIDYEEQDKKAVGNASRITVKDWTTWIEENGLINKGVWVKNPSSKDFYNPSDIVKVQPEVGKPRVIEPTKSEIASYNIVMKNVKEMAKKFRNTNRWDVLLDIVAKHFGEGKKLTEASIEDLSKLESAYSDMEKVFEYEEMPDF